MVQNTTAAKLRELSPNAKRFLDLIEDSIDEGLGKRAIQERIKDAREAEGEGRKGIKDSDLTKARRFIEGDEDITPPSDTRFINKSKSVDIERLRPSTGILTRRFSYQVAIQNTDTGEVIGGVQVVSSERLSISEVEEQALASIESAGVEVYIDEDVPDEFALFVTEALEASGETLL